MIALTAGTLNRMMVRLQALEEGQAELIRLVQQISGRVRGGDEFEDSLPEPAESVEDLENICSKIASEAVFKKQMVAIHLQLLIYCYGYFCNLQINRMKVKQYSLTWNI